MLPLRLRLQNTAALPTPILSLNLVQRLGGSHLRKRLPEFDGHDSYRTEARKAPR